MVEEQVNEVEPLSDRVDSASLIGTGNRPYWWLNCKKLQSMKIDNDVHA